MEYLLIGLITIIILMVITYITYKTLEADANIIVKVCEHSCDVGKTKSKGLEYNITPKFTLTDSIRSNIKDIYLEYQLMEEDLYEGLQPKNKVELSNPIIIFKLPKKLKDAILGENDIDHNTIMNIYSGLQEELNHIKLPEIDAPSTCLCIKHHNENSKPYEFRCVATTNTLSNPDETIFISLWFK